ncbi:MAG: hypothetical protein M5U08_09835 [Burkholderiales bacterium]|nr:hypothetical protein [Burkholderiales bacterium]
MQRHPFALVTRSAGNAQEYDCQPEAERERDTLLVEQDYAEQGPQLDCNGDDDQDDADTEPADDRARASLGHLAP